MDQDIIKKARRIQKIEELLPDAINKFADKIVKVSNDIDSRKESTSEEKILSELLDEFINLKREIKISLMENPVINVDDPELVKILRSISWGDSLNIEKVTKKILKLGYGEEINENDIDYFIKNKLYDEEIEKIAWDILYPETSITWMTRILYKLPSLIINTKYLPPQLNRYLEEAKRCFIFDRDLAVLSLCRAILEISLNGIYIEFSGMYRDRIRYDEAKQNLCSLIDKIKKRELKKKLHKFRETLNKYVHGSIPTKDEISIGYKETIQLVEEIYDSYNLNNDDFFIKTER